MPDPDPEPFGPPAIRTVPLVARRSAARCARPDLVLARLRAAHGAAGTVLLESAGAPPEGGELPTVRRSLLVARPLLRVTLHPGRATFTPLAGTGGRLLEALAGRLAAPEPLDGGLRATYPATSPETLRTDAERLVEPSILDAVRAAAGLCADREAGAPLPPGLFGAFGYELVDHFEALPPRAPDPLGEPDAHLVLAGDMVLYDHHHGTVDVLSRALPWEEMRAARARHAELLALVEGPEPPPADETALAEPAPATSDLEERAYQHAAAGFREAVHAGELFQAVLSRALTLEGDADPLAVYRALRAANPSPYMFLADLPDGALLGASPETFLEVDGGAIEIRPIAGTVPRGRGADGALDPDLDGRLALSLLLDPKEQAEHAMLLDLARNDVARVSVPGTTRVIAQFEVERYRHVQHLVSRVRGTLRPGLDALHAYRAAANPGTLTGAPKLRAMEHIRRAEPTARGFYGGAVGYLLQDGRLLSCIAIRSLRQQHGRWYTRAGAGIVADSVPAREWEETGHKARAVREALARATASGGGTP